ncbi:MAG TPA: ZIP family metal transporter [Candidatus Jeotgalicoccus stercoravium]|nr:ZIP family metal transporter [Candidatus Jeotgalicoccus stercoravium]
MLDFLMTLEPWQQALIATLFTWTMTGLGAAVVFLTRGVSENFLNITLGFAGGIMVAASFWSLLSPAIEASADNPIGEWFPALIGFLAGALFIYLFDKIIPHRHRGEKDAEGISIDYSRRSTLLVTSLTLHNIPEGLSIGILFGAAGLSQDPVMLASALTLAVGIGLQNIPEGTAVSMPLRADGASKPRAFFWGWMSAIVEPISAVIGVLLIGAIEPLLPYALAAGAGAMIFVVVEEVIPSTQKNGHSDAAVFAFLIGFSVMMVLDVALG